MLYYLGLNICLLQMRNKSLNLTCMNEAKQMRVKAPVSIIVAPNTWDPMQEATLNAKICVF
jgi:hypothetical protein